MNIIIVFYILNATLLILHEIESAYEKEWEILKLPCKITGFLLLHIPIIIIFLGGVIEIYKQTMIGMVIAIIAGIAGLIPFVVHKILVRNNECFNKTISNVIMILNIITGISTIILSIVFL